MNVDFAPLPFEPNYRRVASAIAARIRDRSLRAGEPLPSELELAERFAVNRSTVREALRELESGGLVERRRGTKRMVVCRPETGRVAGRVSDALALQDVTAREVWETLTLLEPPIAEAAARGRDAAALERIRAAVEEFAREPSPTPAAVEAVAAFFRAVAAAGGNRVLELVQEPLLLLLAAALERMMDRAPRARTRIATAQRRLLAAIEAGDAAAAHEWMRKHVRDFRRGFEVAGIDLDEPLAAPSGDTGGG